MSLKISKPIVSAEWLESNLENQNLIILDCTIPKVTVKSTSSIYNDKKQIKGAIFFDIKKTFSIVNAPFPNTIIGSKEFEVKSQELGIKKDSAIVCYDDLGIYSSPRVWWMFQLMGFTNIAVLDGGFPKWEEKKYPVEKQQFKSPRKGGFKANYQPNKIKFTEDVLSSINNKDIIIVDARSKGRFYATEPEPRSDVKGGHIPNSVSLPYSELIENGSLKSEVALKTIFNNLNPENKAFIFSCGTGITASILALGAEISGIKNNAVYDGSWTEWGSTEGLPIEIKMKNITWSKNEFLAYVLLYAAHCNFFETKEEENYILSKVDKIIFNKIHTEVVIDSDEENLNKIQQYISENKLSQEEKDALLKDIKNVFFADGSVDVIEKKVFGLLKKIIS
ncbi:sulfurtransferase [Polaribacter sp. Hel1_85]|uniref:sulfurtransferase n=1 Tax=Polaribacter sp. Hel1_85 TaxID=1250005 RepID=UPI00052E3572|nr:sulfurtransferase [Polaribacter sp. Hel1_85]KGL63520.1 thiosulfate sulfurtransferase, rhodanese [Polaribacter sp. Hel1_85]